MMGLVDLHCHLLPGIDDGAKSIEDTKALLEMSAEQGVTNIIFTPHYYYERVDYEEFIERREQAVEKMEPIAKEVGISFRVGAEVRYTPVLASLPLETLAISGTQYLLLELYIQYEPNDVEGLIRRIKKAGYTPILAHIERYPYIEESPLLLYQWIQAGALAQVNAGWLLKDRRAKKRLEQYYHWNLVHFMASDMHSIDRRPQNLEDGYAILPKEIAQEFQRNAETVFAGKMVQTKQPIRPKKVFGQWR
ncbi:MAG: hypothetical protein PUF50_07930 [Erysipelotrichaceae bacterium]|nr:hypothetical protein [Erysipelotrichaceae bacterium]